MECMRRHGGRDQDSAAADAIEALLSRGAQVDAEARGAEGVGNHGLTPVHFSTQPAPFLSLKLHETTQRVPLKVFTTIRQVDECNRLQLVHFSAYPEPLLSLECTVEHRNHQTIPTKSAHIKQKSGRM